MREIRRRRLALFGVLAAALTGCGGEDGQTTPPPPVTGAPTPTPAPTPLPSPTPSPPGGELQPISFAEGFDLQGSLGLTFTSFDSIDGLTPVLSGILNDAFMLHPSTVRLAFAPALGRTTLSIDGVERIFTGNEPVGDNRYLVYSKDYQGLGHRLALGSVDPVKYVTQAWLGDPEKIEVISGRQGKTSRRSAALFGRPSVGGGWIESSMRFHARPDLLRGFNSSDLSASEIHVSLTSGPGDVFGSMSLSAIENATQINRGSLVFTGTLNDTTNQITGTISGDAGPDAAWRGRYEGTFQAALFGPSRDEIAIAYRFNSIAENGQVHSYAGTAMGPRE
jgi:hypothetical protein